jgi:hypothetical protein
MRLEDGSAVVEQTAHLPEGRAANDPYVEVI